MIEIVLRPGRGPGRFEAMHAGEVIVESSRDPEHAAARALVARGVTGLFATRWQGSSHLATRPRDIATTANWSLIEDRRCLRRSRWQPFPKNAQHVRKGGRVRSPAHPPGKTQSRPLALVPNAGNRQSISHPS